MHKIIFVLLMTSCQIAIGQIDSTKYKNLSLTGDFRFRIEQDWNSQNQNGIQRDDRSRLRYRFRFGLKYSLDKHSSFGGRIRSGNINDQQGPHVTLGGNQGEFELVRIGLEKLFYQYKNKYFTAWIGKNAMPLEKLNELFWNDNVFPEGIGLRYKSQVSKIKILDEISINAGHFIINSNNQSFSKDSYLQVFQLNFGLLEKRLKIFPGYYFYKRVGNIPDGKQTFEIDYAILHLGTELIISKKHELKLGIEYYNNLQDYAQNDSIPDNFKDEKSGFVLTMQYGKTKEKGDWLVALSYAKIQKYSIVDYFAQNDWSRWDYSSLGATGSRISNFHGLEAKVGYAFKEKFNLILRSYFVERLVNIGDFKENGNRIRLDLNVGF